MRSIWSGSLSFGLINIPIKVYPAAEEHVLEFDMLHKKDLSPIRYARICKMEGKEIPYDEIVKGYEYEKNEYIVIDKEDFKAANAKKTSMIEIQHFAHLQEIDPIYFDKPYYLEPDNKSAKAYHLLKEALQKSKKVAVASFVFRNKEHFGILRPLDHILVLIQLRYQLEIRSFQELQVPKEKISPKEMDVALMLINKLTQPFNPEKYHDTYTEELIALIEQKVKGKKPSKKNRKKRIC